MAVTPESNNLFKVYINSDPLDAEKADYFHCMTVRLIFYRKRLRSNIQLAMDFLCTRVKVLDK